MDYQESVSLMSDSKLEQELIDLLPAVSEVMEDD